MAFVPINTEPLHIHRFTTDDRPFVYTYMSDPSVT